RLIVVSEEDVRVGALLDGVGPRWVECRGPGVELHRLLDSSLLNAPQRTESVERIRFIRNQLDRLLDVLLSQGEVHRKRERVSVEEHEVGRDEIGVEREGFIQRLAGLLDLTHAGLSARELEPG